LFALRLALTACAPVPAFAAAVPAPEQRSEPAGEYQVKAAFLFNFIRFAEWPATSFHTPTEPIAVCILGSDPFGPALSDAVAQHNVGGRPLVVRHLNGVKDIGGCHALFISSSEARHAGSLLSKGVDAGILTVGDSDSTGTPIPYGTAISFRLDAEKVRFDIDMDAAEREKIRISSRLLSLARVVKSPPK
jgi:hypothetical protein